MKRALIAAALLSLAAPANADVSTAQIQALWEKIRSTPDLAEVDQIVIEGDASSHAFGGELQRRRWAQKPKAWETVYWKRFYATFERICPQDVSACFRVTGIWSNGKLIAGTEVASHD